MGLIRKTLAVGTIGAVNGSSKKQRVARQSLDVQRDILAELRLVTAAAAAPVATLSPATYRPSLVPVTSSGGASWLDAYRVER